MTLIGDQADSTPTRRRGAELEGALLDAAWDELIDKGYDDFTIESVAERAHTSRAVVYRRWPGKAELIRSAAARAGANETVTTPNTGSLRNDVIELLREANQMRAHVALQLFLRIGNYHAETGDGIAELRDAYLSKRDSPMRTILERAIKRGEIDARKLTPRVIAVPFDLYRQELMLTLKSVPDDVAESIVDEVFLPLVLKT